PTHWVTLRHRVRWPSPVSSEGASPPPLRGDGAHVPDVGRGARRGPGAPGVGGAGLSRRRRGRGGRAVRGRVARPLGEGGPPGQRRRGETPSGRAAACLARDA